MIDAQCTKCCKRFGWAGSFADRPACPKCGDRPPQADLEAIDLRMDADRKLFDTHPQRATLEQLRMQRVKAGLTNGQAAKLLGIDRKLLSDIEWGRTQLSAELAQKMAAIYGG